MGEAFFGADLRKSITPWGRWRCDQRCAGCCQRQQIAGALGDQRTKGDGGAYAGDERADIHSVAILAVYVDRVEAVADRIFPEAPAGVIADGDLGLALDDAGLAHTALRRAPSHRDVLQSRLVP